MCSAMDDEMWMRYINFHDDNNIHNDDSVGNTDDGYSACTDLASTPRSEFDRAPTPVIDPLLLENPSSGEEALQSHTLSGGDNNDDGHHGLPHVNSPTFDSEFVWSGLAIHDFENSFGIYPGIEEFSAEFCTPTGLGFGTGTDATPTTTTTMEEQDTPIQSSTEPHTNPDGWPRAPPRRGQNLSMQQTINFLESSPSTVPIITTTATATATFTVPVPPALGGGGGSVSGDPAGEA
jgi:hypothetical protein